VVLQALIEVEATQYIGADRYERTQQRTAHRNGTRARLLSTKAGDVERCFALQAEGRGAGAVPAAWGLPVARQILLVVGGQLAGVVRLPPHRQLGDVGHHPAPASSPSLARANAPLVHCSSNDVGSSVEQTAKRHPLWRAQLSKAAAGAGGYVPSVDALMAEESE
jgi:hypothetical protein